MDGRIRTNEVCPVCGGRFDVEYSREGIGEFLCLQHRTRPKRVYIDARKMRAGKIYKDAQGRPFLSYSEAQRRLEEMRAQVDRNSFDPSRFAPPRLKNYRLATQAEAWIGRVERECSDAYFKAAKITMRNHAIPELGALDVREVRRFHLEGYRETLVRKGLAPSSVKTHLDYLAAFFGWLFELELIERRPRFPKVTIPYREKAWIGRDVQTSIIQKIADRHRLLFETMIETGCRPGEIAGLRVRDLVGGEIVIERAIDGQGKVKETKTGKVWYKQVSPVLFDKLANHTRGRFPNDYIFRNRYGKPYRSRGLWAIWKAAAQSVGVNVSQYPGTRHSRVSQLRVELERRMAVELAAELGHNSTATTMKHYARPKREQFVHELSAVDSPPGIH